MEYDDYEMREWTEELKFGRVMEYFKTLRNKWYMYCARLKIPSNQQFEVRCEMIPLIGVGGKVVLDPVVAIYGRRAFASSFLAKIERLLADNKSNLGIDAYSSLHTSIKPIA